MRKKVLVILLILALTSTYFVTYAATVSDYQAQQKETEAEQNKAKENLQAVTQEKNSVQAQVTELNSSIEEVQAEMSDLQDKIEKLDVSIEENEKDLKEKQKLLEERLVVSYMNGSNTYLDALFSGGLSKFVSNYQAIKQIAEYDSKLIDEVKQVKKDLESNKIELENSKVQVIAKKTQLESKKSEREEKVKSLSEEEKVAQAEVEQKESELAKINAAVKTAQKKIEEQEKVAAQNKVSNSTSNSASNSSSNTTGNVSQTTSGSMSWPTRIAHKINSVYAPGGRTDAGEYAGTAHKGLDINAPQGTPIYAAQTGTVVYVNYSGYGGGWGLYVVIYHGKDSEGRAVYTRYAHASAIASGIAVGSSVTTGTVIMYAGNTGASTGAHLHFEVCLNSMYNQVNPAPYLGIPNKEGTY